jgi:hypothetical protein
MSEACKYVGTGVCNVCVNTFMGLPAVTLEAYSAFGAMRQQPPAACGLSSMCRCAPSVTYPTGVGEDLELLLTGTK